MPVPGSNILNQAFRAIAKDSVDWYVFLSSSTNDIGMKVNVYEPPVTVRGSVQAIHKSKYSDLGLDFEKKYLDFYVSNSIMGVERDYSGDYVIFKGTRFYVESSTEWFQIDGWNNALLVEATLDNA